MFKHLRHAISSLALCVTTFPVCATYDSAEANTQNFYLANTRSVNECSEEYYDFFKMMHIIKVSLEFSEEVAANFEGALSSKNLCEYENIMQAKEFISTFVSTLDLYEKKYKEEIVLLESRIKESMPAFKELEECRAILIQLMSEYFFIEREGAEIVNDMLDFSSTKLGSFWESNGSLIFQKDEDAAMYNALVRKLIQASKEENILIEKLEMHRQWILKKMENIVLK